MRGGFYLSKYMEGPLSSWAPPLGVVISKKRELVIIDWAPRASYRGSCLASCSHLANTGLECRTR
jgi:hypothetical protein